MQNGDINGHPMKANGPNFEVKFSVKPYYKGDLSFFGRGSSSSGGGGSMLLLLNQHNPQRSTACQPSSACPCSFGIRQ